MNKKYLLSAFLVLFTMCLFAQSKGLKLGDDLPPYLVQKILNGNQRRLNTSDFKDKLLLLDFWATSCSGCVEALPRMEALQKQFGERIKVLPVTFEPEALVASFWKQNGHTKNLTIPTAVEDKQFQEYFPHEVIPHEIWVYKGKVIGITSESYTDADNITQVLNGKIPHWPVKDDYYAFDASKKSVFAPDEHQIDIDHTKLEYVATCGYIEKNGSSAAGPFGGVGIVRDSIHKMIRVYYLNMAILSIYTMNWNTLLRASSQGKKSPRLAADNIVWDVIDPLKYAHRTAFTPTLNTPYIEDWVRDHSICFEAQYADTGQTDKDIAKKVISDLNRILGLNVRWEKREEKNPGTGSGEKSHLVDKFVFSEVDGGLVVDAKMIATAQAKKHSQESLLVPSESEGLKFLEENKKKPGVVTLSSGLQYKIIKTGKGAKPGLNAKVLVHFTGSFVNGKIFESSFEGGLPYAPKINQVLKGWTEALQMMPVGSQWEIYLPADLAYGKPGNLGIPPNTPLVFDIQLLKILE